MEIGDRNAAGVQHLCRLLDGLIRLKKVKYREVDRLLGASAGVARRILNGKIELKARHIFAILHYLGIEQKAFFRVAFESPYLEEQSDEVILADQIRRIGAQHQEESSIVSRAEIEHLVVSLLEGRGLIDPKAPSPSKD
jgi:hypothetical protein